MPTATSGCRPWSRTCRAACPNSPPPWAVRARPSRPPVAPWPPRRRCHRRPSLRPPQRLRSRRKSNPPASTRAARISSQPAAWSSEAARCTRPVASGLSTVSTQCLLSEVLRSRRRANPRSVQRSQRMAAFSATPTWPRVVRQMRSRRQLCHRPWLKTLPSSGGRIIGGTAVAKFMHRSGCLAEALPYAGIDRPCAPDMISGEP